MGGACGAHVREKGMSEGKRPLERPNIDGMILR